MKKLLIAVMAMGFISTARASEARPLSLICATESKSLTLSFFSHDDVIQSGLMDVLVQIKLARLGNETYLINDIKGSSIDNGSKTKIYYTNGDIILDVVIDNKTDTAAVFIGEGLTEKMACTSDY